RRPAASAARHRGLPPAPQPVLPGWQPHQPKAICAPAAMALNLRARPQLIDKVGAARPPPRRSRQLPAAAGAEPEEVSFMLSDRYGNGLTSSSRPACDAYVAAVDLLLAASPGAEAAFHRAIACDPRLAVAHVGLARALQLRAQPEAAKAAIAGALELSDGLSARGRGHVEGMNLVIHGKSAPGLGAGRRPLCGHSRGAMGRGAL